MVEGTAFVQVFVEEDVLDSVVHVDSLETLYSTKQEEMLPVFPVSAGVIVVTVGHVIVILVVEFVRVGAVKFDHETSIKLFGDAEVVVDVQTVPERVEFSLTVTASGGQQPIAVAVRLDIGTNAVFAVPQQMQVPFQTPVVLLTSMQQLLKLVDVVQVQVNPEQDGEYVAFGAFTCASTKKDDEPYHGPRKIEEASRKSRIFRMF